MRLAILAMVAAVLFVSDGQVQALQQSPVDDGSLAVVTYAPPLLTEVIDSFRPPEHIGDSGNRGLEYGNSDNQIVAAAASGYVLFAGPVAGRKAITIEHADGIRTTYTGLLEVWAVEGSIANQYSAIAIASRGFHFGARVRDHYLDPQILLDASESSDRPRLVPWPD
jgi:murein DD-endopeptidase MepM/ murein hydrolase activator NlpD